MDLRMVMSFFRNINQILLSTASAVVHDDAYVKNKYNAGSGRSDIIVINKQNKDIGLVNEIKNIKVRTTKERLDNSVKVVLKQIIAKGYEQELITLGVKNIMLFGVAFYKNKVSIITKKSEQLLISI